MKKRILACFMCLCMVLSVAPTIVFADDIQEGEVENDYNLEEGFEGSNLVEEVEKDKLKVKSENGDKILKPYWNGGFQDSVVVIGKCGTVVVEGDTKIARLEIKTEDKGTVYIKLKDLNMNLAEGKMGFLRARNGIYIHPKGNVENVIIEVIGTNKIISYMGAGIVNGANCNLNITGTGSLEVEGGLMRIGKTTSFVEGSIGWILDMARNEFDETNKTLCLGYAGITGSCNLSCRSIIARGGGFAAGIGSGVPANRLNFEAGEFIAECRKVLELLRGLSLDNLLKVLDFDSMKNNINITGGTVNATGGPGGGAGIGGCAYFYNSTINITGGNVTATGGTYEKEGKKIGGGAGIGGGYWGFGEKISIEGTEKNRTTVTAIGGHGAAAIGGGIGRSGVPNSGNARLIKIGNHSTVTATADNTDGAAIGCGDAGSSLINLSAGDYFINVGSGAKNGEGSVITTFGGRYGMGTSKENVSQKINIYGGDVTFNNCKRPFKVNPNMKDYNGEYDIAINGNLVDKTKEEVYTNELTGKRVFEIRRKVAVTGDNVIGSLEELDNTSTDNKNQDEGKNSNLVDSLVDSKASSKITDSKAFKTGENNNMLVIYILTSTVSLVCVAFVLRKRKSFNK